MGGGISTQGKNELSNLTADEARELEKHMKEQLSAKVKSMGKNVDMSKIDLGPMLGISKPSDVPFGPDQKPWDELVPSGAVITGPVDNPIGMYEKVPGIDPKLFQLPPGGLTPEQREAALAQLKSYVQTQAGNFLGFQTNQSQNTYSQRLSWMMDLQTNNVGDPFDGGYLTCNTKFVERAVLDFFAALWNAEWPHSNKSSTQGVLRRFWGYVLTMGCTEANMYGLFNGRDYLKGLKLMQQDNPAAAAANLPSPYVTVYPADRPVGGVVPTQYTPLLFYSEDVHYSVVKAGRVMDVPTFFEIGNSLFPRQCPLSVPGLAPGCWPQSGVPSRDRTTDAQSGGMNLTALKTLLDFFCGKGYPPLIVCNVGSTWKGAYDDIPGVNAVLTELGSSYPWLWSRQIPYTTYRQDGTPQSHTDTRRGFWLYVDGALGAAVLPFLEMAEARGLLPHQKAAAAAAACGDGEQKLGDPQSDAVAYEPPSGPVPRFDFRIPAVMAIGCSMHKFIGGPWPSGVYMTRVGYQLSPPATDGYIGSPDTTLGGSRNGVSPCILWDYFSRMGYEANMEKALLAETLSHKFVGMMLQLQSDLRAKFSDPAIDLWVTHSHLSLTVGFRRIRPDIMFKYSVDAERMWIPLQPDDPAGGGGSGVKYQLRAVSHVFFMKNATLEKLTQLVDDLRAACESDWHGGFPEILDGQPNPGATLPYDPSRQGTSNPTASTINGSMIVPTQGRGLRGRTLQDTSRGGAAAAAAN